MERLKAIMEELKGIIIITFMILFLFSFHVFWYYNFKELYELTIKGKIIYINESGRGGRQIKVSEHGEYYSIYCDHEEIYKIGDSISKEKESPEFKIYRKSESSGNWEYRSTIHFRKDLEFYSLVVGEK